jgi:3-phenylpropionate/trans-cinnamate dioxygenase ferredoxin subunit
MKAEGAILIGLYLMLGLLPAYTFFCDKGGMALLNGSDFAGACGVIFPLLGLYAFYLAWGQILIGALMPILQKQISWIETYHRAQGMAVLLLATMHPVLLWISMGNKSLFTFSYVAPEQRIFAVLGMVQLAALFLTVGTAMLMKLPILIGRWHYIHYLNYLIFISIFIHSWNLGSDLAASQALRYLWIFFGATALAASLNRFWRGRGRAKISTSTKSVNSPMSSSQATRETAATVDDDFSVALAVKDLSLGKPACTSVWGKDILICQLADGIYAIDDTCSHAGGSLSKGTLTGSTIECPKHHAKFDVRTGEVVSPPAKVPVAAYRVRVSGDNVEVAP